MLLQAVRLSLMFKYLYGIFLALIGLSVQAQSTFIPKEGLPGLATVTPVSFPYAIEDIVGNHYFIVTKDALGLYDIWGTSCLKSSCITESAFYARVIATRSLPDPVAGFKAWYEQSIQFACSKAIRAETTTERGALCREQRRVTCAVLQAQYNTKCSSDTATAPPPAVWVVTSVNAYTVTNGSKALFPTGKATLGATCDCSPLTGYKFTNLFGSTFCKAEVVDATLPMVAGCSIKR